MRRLSWRPVRRLRRAADVAPSIAPAPAPATGEPRARPSRSGTDAATWGPVAAALRAALCGAGRARARGENRASPAAEFALADGDDEDGEGRIAGFAS